MAWIGPPGNLIEFKCPSALDVTPGDRRAVFTSMAGAVSVTTFAQGPLPRVWRVSVDTARPQDVSGLLALSVGEWGPGPFAWVPPGAEHTNLLTPAASLCLGAAGSPAGVSQGGPVAGSGFRAGSSWNMGTASYINMGEAPALPGVPATVRAWCVGGSAYLTISARDAAGGILATQQGPTTPATGGAWVSATMLNPPAGTATVRYTMRGATVATRPSVTWTTTPRQWGVGAAATAVTVAAVPTVFQRAAGTPGAETLTSHQFDVQEVTSGIA